MVWGNSKASCPRIMLFSIFNSLQKKEKCHDTQAFLMLSMIQTGSWVLKTFVLP